MNVVTNPTSLIAHRSPRLAYYDKTPCGIDATSFPLARDCRPWRFCSRCFTDRERELLTDLLPEVTTGPAREEHP